MHIAERDSISGMPRHPTICNMPPRTPLGGGYSAPQSPGPIASGEGLAAPSKKLHPRLGPYRPIHHWIIMVMPKNRPGPARSGHINFVIRG